MTASTLPKPRPNSGHRVTGASLAALLVIGSAHSGVAQGAATPAAEPTLAAATRAMGQGRPYLATRLLTPLLAAPDTREPEVVLLAARAAAGWEGWGTVARLLGGEPWLDKLDDGAGRALLAEARVERGEDAVEDARVAVRLASSETLGARLVVLARAYDRANQLDSAAAVYRRAAGRLPPIADWLRLRAAGVLSDSAERAGLYREVSLDAATPRIRWTEALARERTGDEAGAARQYEALGSAVDAARLRLGAGPDSAGRAAIRAELLEVLGRPIPPDDARAAIGLVDQIGGTQRAADELVIARKAAVVDLLSRAALGYSKAKPLKDPDQYSYGVVLARLGRHRDAMAAFAAIRAPEFKTQAAYQRAKSLLQVGTRKAAIAALRRVARGMVKDSAVAATAGFLAADLLVDEGNEVTARTQYLEVARRFPTTMHGSRAALVAAVIAYSSNEWRDAARELKALADRPGDKSEAAAALYWGGRALKAIGDSNGAKARWKLVLERYPTSYYVLPARDRLGLPRETASVTPPSESPSEELSKALDRAQLLDRLGMRVEARFELDRISRGAEGSAGLLPATALAFAGRGYAARAYKLALRSSDANLQRLVFPIPRKDDLFDEARAAGVDPFLAASLIRQESGFDPSARSGADARGLMQVVPSVGAAFARAEGLKEWDASLLYQPELNVHFGLAHLAASLRRSPHLAHALAAYNAGTRAADDWVGLPGAKKDPEIFIERIQYAETRDYVRRILKNLAAYRALYPATP